MSGMEGVFIVIKAWGLAAFLIWVHRRFFERVGRRERGFEARIAQGVRLAALQGDASRLAEIETELCARLGKRRRAIATLGGYPWPHYELELRLVQASNVLTLFATRAELARVHARPAPALVTVLGELLAGHGDAIEDHWLAPDMIYGTGDDAASAGYLVRAGSGPKARVAPRTRTASWLGPAEPAISAAKPDAAASVAHPNDAKLLRLSREC